LVITILLMKTRVIFFYLLVFGTSVFGQNFEELEFNFTLIDSTSYLEYKKNYFNHIVLDSSLKTIPDSSFSLYVNGEEKPFECTTDYSACIYYVGLIEPLNSYIITTCNEGSCSTLLLNKATGESNYLFSPFDSECEAPLLSKNQTKILVFASSVFGNESFISIHSRKEIGDDFNFDLGKSVNIEDFRIYEAIWIDETTIAIKTFQEFGGVSGSQPLNVQYLKGNTK